FAVLALAGIVEVRLPAEQRVGERAGAEQNARPATNPAGVSALVAGVLGWLLARSGAVYLVGPIARKLAADRHVPFLADLGAHAASYLVGLAAGIVVMARVWRSRGWLAAAAAQKPDP